MQTRWHRHLHSVRKTSHSSARAGFTVRISKHIRSGAQQKALYNINNNYYSLREIREASVRGGKREKFRYFPFFGLPSRFVFTSPSVAALSEEVDVVESAVGGVMAGIFASLSSFSPRWQSELIVIPYFLSLLRGFSVRSRPRQRRTQISFTYSFGNLDDKTSSLPPSASQDFSQHWGAGGWRKGMSLESQQQRVKKIYNTKSIRGDISCFSCILFRATFLRESTTTVIEGIGGLQKKKNVKKSVRQSTWDTGRWVEETKKNNLSSYSSPRKKLNFAFAWLSLTIPRHTPTFLIMLRLLSIGRKTEQNRSERRENICVLFNVLLILYFHHRSRTKLHQPNWKLICTLSIFLVFLAPFYSGGCCRDDVVWMGEKQEEKKYRRPKFVPMLECVLLYSLRNDDDDAMMACL